MAELSTVARPYAKAAFENAVAGSTLDAWSQQLKTAAAVAVQEAVQKVFASPSMTSQQQADAFITVCGDTLDAKGQNFVKVLSDNKRLGLLPEISKQFEQHKAALEKNVEVEVSTAFELDAASIEALGNALKTKLERDVKVNTVVDKSLVGGVYIRAGDIVIDSSVRGRLAKLAEAMNV